MVRKVRQVLKAPQVPSVHVVIPVTSDYKVTLAAQEMPEIVDRTASLESGDRTAYLALLDNKDAKGQPEQVVALDQLVIQDHQDLLDCRDWLAVRVLKVYLAQLVLPVLLDQKVSRVVQVHRDCKVAKVPEDQMALQETPVRTTLLSYVCKIEIIFFHGIH